MRIALVTHTTSGRGGIERVVELQTAQLRARGHTVDIVTGPALGGHWTGRALSAGLLAFRRARKLREYDVVLAHYQPAPWLAARSECPFVHYFHHPLRAVHPTSVQLTKRRYRLWNRLMQPLKSLDMRTVRAAHSVAVPSPSVGRDLMAFYGREPVLLPLGVDNAQLIPGGTRGDHLLFVGRLAETYKHLDWAIEVARRVGRPLHIAGEGRIPEPGAGVTSLGYLRGDELAAAYRSAAVLLFPSVHEDFGLVPLEAMACGLPVVAWDDQHGPSLTMAEGSGGRLVPPYDLDAFAAAVTALVEDPQQHAKLSEAGPAWVAQHFSLQRHIDGLEELLVAAASAKSNVKRLAPVA